MIQKKSTGSVESLRRRRGMRLLQGRDSHRSKCQSDVLCYHVNFMHDSDSISSAELSGRVKKIHTVSHNDTS